MSRKNRSSRWQGTGEEIHVPIGTYADARQSVLQLYSVCAYPHISEKPKRDPFARAFHNATYKAQVSGQAKNKYDSAAVRALPLPAAREMSNQQIRGKLGNGFKRMFHCLNAGNIAARFYLKGRRFLYQTSEGIRGLEIAGPDTIAEASRDLLKLQAEVGGVHHSAPGIFGGIHKAAQENVREGTLHRFAPVLHLAFTLHAYIEGFPEDIPCLVRFYDLVERPEWLHHALLYAEGLRGVLHKSVPCFDPDHAVRFLPAESLTKPVPRLHFFPTTGY